MNGENMIEKMIEEEAELRSIEEIGYEECGNDCDDSTKESVVLKVLKKLAVPFAIVGTTIVLYKCKGCMTKWAVRMLQKKGYTVINPNSNLAIFEDVCDEDPNEQDFEVEETEEV